MLAITPTAAEYRNVCRRGGITTAWLAVDYYQEPGCPIAGGEQYTGAVVVRHEQRARGTALLACADQRVPRGWAREALPADAAVEGLCRTSRVVEPTALVTLVRKQT
jgi:hypothetical protein